MGQSLWKQYYWDRDMLGAFHDADDNGIDTDGIVSSDSVGNPNFDQTTMFFTEKITSMVLSVRCLLLKM